VILEGDRLVLERAAAALRDPIWGVWLGRKNCIPAERIYRGLFDTELQAQHELVGDRPIDEFTTVTEVKDFAEGTDSVSDQPVSFGDGTSSGPDKRQFAVRRIKVVPGSPPAAAGGDQGVVVRGLETPDHPQPLLNQEGS
jgi:CRISPR system Cascade subunit CasD